MLKYKSSARCQHLTCVSSRWLNKKSRNSENIFYHVVGETGFSNHLKLHKRILFQTTSTYCTGVPPLRSWSESTGTRERRSASVRAKPRKIRRRKRSAEIWRPTFFNPMLPKIHRAAFIGAQLTWEDALTGIRVESQTDKRRTRLWKRWTSMRRRTDRPLSERRTRCRNSRTTYPAENSTRRRTW